MDGLATFLHHPRKLWLRRALFQIHLWAGLLLTLYIVVIALTGSILVFRREMNRAQLPRTLHRYDVRQVASIEEVLGRFRSTYPGATLDTLEMPSTLFPAFYLSVTDADHRPVTLVGDSLTGALVAQRRTWIDWVYDLHVYLLLGRTHGMQVNGVGAVGLLLLALSGLYLWWPGVKTWRRGLRIHFSRNWRRINFDLHHAIGFWTLFIVSWWAFSGIYFAWYREVTALVAAFSPLEGMHAPVAPVPTPQEAHRTTLAQILAAVHEASPRGTLFSLSDPLLTGESVYALVDLGAPGDFSHRDILTLSTADARVLTAWHYGQNHTLGDWILWSMHPLHFGSLWGTAVQVIWALAGVALAVLAITGVLMYWNRYLRHQVRLR
jgi:uncharacterized iron-regulated membrane protein